MPKKIAVIGSGISGLSAAAYAARQGHEVYVFEKNDTAGGRARQFQTDNGYVFDMGPSWYWMPDIIEGFFNDFGKTANDFYDLVPLNPQFEMIFSDGALAVPEGMAELAELFESMEHGSGKRLELFMKSARYKYEIGMQEFVNKPCHSWREFISPKIAVSALRLDLFSNFRSYVSQYFSNPKLKTLMEFPVIFLGASPQRIPALYSLMNYGGYALGTWYPVGGFYSLIRAMKSVAEEQGAKFHFSHTVEKITTRDGKVSSLTINGNEHVFDAVIASSDYHHTESLLPANLRNYDDQYWNGRTFAPSCLIYYLGLRETIPRLKHHTLFFEHELDEHVEDIYTRRKWPENPLFYACCPSKT
ncbi:MAG TPA: phytoene desaturase family protein, partial [Chitinophagaceae bacterium]|nr:phytoene desaturase family protein [Chitinophagaceae bacterium]